MSDAVYRVVRTETIHYYGEFTKEELLEAGCDPEVFTESPDNDSVLSELALEAIDNDVFHEALTDWTEGSANVDGNMFAFFGGEE